MTREVGFFFRAIITLSIFGIWTGCSSPLADPAVVEVDKTALVAALTAANTLYEVTDVGIGPLTTTESAKIAYLATTTEAQSVADNSSATQSQVDAAVTALNTATAVFNEAIEPGLPEYIYSTAGTNTITQATPDAWGSGSEGSEIISDATYNPCIQVIAGQGWSVGYYAACQAYREMEVGVLATYRYIVLKVKEGDYVSFKVSVPGTTVIEKEYFLTDGTALSGGWLQMRIPLSVFAPNTSTSSEFGIFSIGNGTLYLTDIGFEQ